MPQEAEHASGVSDWLESTSKKMETQGIEPWTASRQTITQSVMQMKSDTTTPHPQDMREAGLLVIYIHISVHSTVI